MTPCIEHTQNSKEGYGRTSWGGKKTSLHRKAYCIANGLSLEQIEGVTIRHRCDNRRCINSEHLEDGTQRDNLIDRRERGNPFKLDRAKIEEIKLRFTGAESNVTIAKDYGVHHSMIALIRTGGAWA